jgi:C4-type Zn-finger protein
MSSTRSQRANHRGIEFEGTMATIENIDRKLNELVQEAEKVDEQAEKAKDRADEAQKRLDKASS